MSRKLQIYVDPYSPNARYRYNIINHKCEKLLPFNVGYIYDDFVVERDNKYNLFNAKTRKLQFPIWFPDIGYMKLYKFKFDDESTIYVLKHKVKFIHLNKRCNFITNQGEFLFSKWHQNDKVKFCDNGILIRLNPVLKNTINFNFLKVWNPTNKH